MAPLPAPYRFTTPVLILICLTRGSAMVPRAPRKGRAENRGNRGGRRRGGGGPVGVAGAARARAHSPPRPRLRLPLTALPPRTRGPGAGGVAGRGPVTAYRPALPPPSSPVMEPALV